MEKLELNLTVEEEITLEGAIEECLYLYYHTYMERTRYDIESVFKSEFNKLYQLRKKLQEKNILTKIKDNDIDIMYNAINE